VSEKRKEGGKKIEYRERREGGILEGWGGLSEGGGVELGDVA